jgi:penicillin-binding protein 1A
VDLPDYLQGAAVVLNNRTGGILALVGGRDFSHSEYNRAIQAQRPAGTAFTPLVYATAFQMGMFPGERVEDNVIDNREVMIGGQEGILGEWGAESASNRYEGKIPARFALVKGKNAATVRVGFKAGLENVREMARRSGIDSSLSEFPKTFLGESGVTPLELTLAYTNYANNGKHPARAQIIDHINDNDGNRVFQSSNQMRTALDAPIAYQMHSCLKDVLEEGTGAAARDELGLAEFDGGGKTGTAYNFTDLWFLGYNSEITCGVWAGFDKPKPIFQGAFSKDIVLPVWVDIMNVASQVYDPQPLPKPAGLERIETCLMSGELATQDQCYETRILPNGQQQRWRSTYMEYATQEQKPTKLCSYHLKRGMTLPEFLGERDGSDSAAPRPEPVIREQLPPVHVKSMTVVNLERDPYSSVSPKDIDERKEDLQRADPTRVKVEQKKILRAQPVGPLEREMQENSDRFRLNRPGALDVNDLE